jgi:hypothetical protein
MSKLAVKRFSGKPEKAMFFFAPAYEKRYQFIQPPRQSL